MGKPENDLFDSLIFSHFNKHRDDILRVWTKHFEKCGTNTIDSPTDIKMLIALALEISRENSEDDVLDVANRFHDRIHPAFKS